MARKAPKPTQAAAGEEASLPKIAILGIGQMGLVCASLLSDKVGRREDSEFRRSTGGSGCRVVIWGHSPEEAGALAQTRRSPRLPGFKLPEGVRVAMKDKEAVEGAALIVSAVPVQYMREVWKRLTKHVDSDAAVLSVAKGIENETLMRPTQVVADVLLDDPDSLPRRTGVLSGPTIAAELPRSLPATMIAASDDVEFARAVQHTFSASWLRVYTNPDTLGVE